jgi:hypothetical protein
VTNTAGLTKNCPAFQKQETEHGSLLEKSHQLQMKTSKQFKLTSSQSTQTAATPYHVFLKALILQLLLNSLFSHIE